MHEFSSWVGEAQEQLTARKTSQMSEGCHVLHLPSSRSARLISVFCSISCALAEPVAGLAAAERLIPPPGHPPRRELLLMPSPVIHENLHGSGYCAVPQTRREVGQC
jgi:hypothetical protein